MKFSFVNCIIKLIFTITFFIFSGANSLLAANLILKSNFGKGTTLSAPYGFYTLPDGGGGAWQSFSGIDSETGFDWSSNILGSIFNGLQIITMDPVDSITITDHAQNKIREVTGPSGKLTNELFLNLKKKVDAGYVPTGKGPAQIPFMIKRPSNIGDVNNFYMSYWFKHQADLATKLDNTIESGNWRVQFAFKTGGYNNTEAGDYRISIVILKDKDGKLYWSTKGDNVANGPWSKVIYWNIDNKSIPVPVGEWFKFEVYWHRSSGSDGRFWAAVNGQVIADHFGPNMGDYSLPITRIFAVTSYTGGWPEVQTQMTGIEIWDGFPCGVGLSCFGASITPKVNKPILDQAWTESVPGNFVVPANTFVDPDGGIMTYSAKLASGSSLPAWLSFDPGTRTFSGTPPKMVGSYTVRVIATDDKTKSVYDDFILKINNRPVLNTALPDFVWTENTTESYSFSDTTFSDIDGDALTYTAILTDGSPLPSWLTFTSSTRTLAGTPPRGAASFNIRITAADPHGLSVHDDMIIKINNKPSVSSYVPDQKWNENKLKSYAIPSGFFKDIDGDSLTYSALLSNGSALPSWLTFAPSTQTFSGTPPRGIATYNIRVKAVDPRGLYVTDDFKITINNKPNIANPLIDQSWKEGLTSSFVIPSNAFNDIDGDLLSYRATLPDGSTIPTWMSFSASTRTLSGKPPVGASNITIRIWAEDTNYLRTYDDVLINTP